jgi:hypothetical protein
MRQLGGGAVAAAAWQRQWQYGGGSVRRWWQWQVAAVCGNGGGGGRCDGSLAVAAEVQQRSGWDGATIERCTFSSGIKDSTTDDNRGATAPSTPSSNARTFERHRHADRKRERGNVMLRYWNFGRAPGVTSSQGCRSASLSVPPMPFIFWARMWCSTWNMVPFT